MKKKTDFIRRHPMVIYFALTFGISWGGVLIAIGPGGSPGTTWQSDTRLQFVVLSMLAGPSVAGILMTGLVYGKAGFRELLSRLLKWRVGVHWYAIALLVAPFLMAVVLLALSMFSPVFLPAILVTDDKVSLLLSGITAGLITGICEELGWTGFAVPRLRLRRGVVSTGLVVGLLWGAWHFLVNVWAGGTISGSLSLALFLPLYFFSGVGQLAAYRVLMVWVYDRTGSLLVAMLMHASLTASTLFILAPSATGVLFLTWFFVLTAVLWCVVAAVGRRKTLSRQGVSNDN